LIAFGATDSRFHDGLHVEGGFPLRDGLSHGIGFLFLFRSGRFKLLFRIGIFRLGEMVFTPVIFDGLEVYRGDFGGQAGKRAQS
jgi:hypothetical protein